MTPDTFSNTVVMNLGTYDYLKKMFQEKLNSIPESEYWRNDEVKECVEHASIMGITLEQ
ncbi:hypothetical protein [Spongiimicrobium salis]|uniref:hypothetical protein n=1 Tax=Spongiimicrobium salis TaxID=1667022 RepID=UPI00374DCC6D